MYYIKQNQSKNHRILNAWDDISDDIKDEIRTAMTTTLIEIGVI